MPDKSLRDQNVRRAAIFTDDHAFVWASAGTGKTHTLTLRALYLLLEWGRPGLYRAAERRTRRHAARKVIRYLTLTTFTRKAAAEMHERLYLYLDTMAQSASFEDLQTHPLAQKDLIFLEIVEEILRRIPGQDFKLLRAGAQALAECASELQISTIHSLCVSILKRHPFEAGLRPGARIAEEEEGAVTVKEQLIERWWQKEAFSHPDNERDLSEILQFIPVSQLQQWLGWSWETPWLINELCGLSPPIDLEESLASLENLTGTLKMIKRGKVPQTVAELSTLLSKVKAAQEGAWTELSRFLFAKKDYLFISGRQTPKSVIHALSELPSPHRENLETYLKTYSTSLRAAVHREHPRLWKTWVQLLGRFSKWVQSAVMDELGLVSFDEMIRKAKTLLEDNEDVRRFEFDRLRALLVDEFQDTDPFQLDLIATLLRRPPGCRHEVLGFFVGDTKQSIYRFRGADVLSVVNFFEQYERYTNPLRSKQEFNLQTNFRSCGNVTGFANYFFSDRFPLAKESELLFSYRDETAAPIRWRQLEPKNLESGISAEEGRQLTAEAAAAAIKEYVGEGNPETRYQDILVLTRSNRELDTLLPILLDAGIPVAASGAGTYYQQQEVLDMLNLLIALHHPLDTVAVAAVLRSPLIRLSDDEIHRLSEMVSFERLFHSEDFVPDFIPEFSTHRIHELRRLASRRQENPVSEWLQEIQGYIPKVLSPPPHDNEGRSIVRMSRLLKAFRQETLTGNCPPIVWLLNQRSRARAADRWDEDGGEDINLFDEGVDAVRAMTIHKAKGLEARFVIICSWTSILEESLGVRRAETGQIIELQKEDGTRLRAFSLPWGPVRIVTDNYLQAVELESSYACEEALRLAYVSVTRACDQLLLIQFASKYLDGHLFSEELARSARKFGSTVEFAKWTGVGQIRRESRPSHLKLDTEAHRLLWESRRESCKALKPLVRHPTDVEFHPVTSEAKEHSASSSLATGRLVHAYLERQLKGDFSVTILEELWRQMRSDQMEPSSLEQAKDILSDFCIGKLRDRSGRPLRQRIERGIVLAQEIPVFLTIDRQPWHGVIDLILEDESIIWGIDFKTGWASESLPEVYRQQEAVYTEALRRLFPDRQVSFEFWWLGTGVR